jgi:hypothetical protein
MFSLRKIKWVEEQDFRVIKRLLMQSGADSITQNKYGSPLWDQTAEWSGTSLICMSICTCTNINIWFEAKQVPEIFQTHN